MAENFSFAELIIPGAYIRVRAEGLISVGGISTGNIGIVGTAQKPTSDADPTPDPSIYDKTFILSDYGSAQVRLGVYDSYADGAGVLNLTRALEVAYRNGASTVYARPVPPPEPPGAALDPTAFDEAFREVLKEDVNILIAPELTTQTAINVLQPLVDSAENINSNIGNQDLIAVIGSDVDTASEIVAQAPTNKRIILTTPGFSAFDSAANNGAGAEVALAGNYGAAAVAGLLSTLPPQSSPTNKTLSGLSQLSQRFSYGETKDLISGRVLVLEQRQGVRVVRGITTDDGAFRQITTRRIVNFAKDGVRAAANPFIGKLNNARVRGALQGAISGFLDTMVVDEALIGYSLEVTASRADEIAGRAIVNAVLQPTFSIDFVAVTMVLE